MEQKREPSMDWEPAQPRQGSVHSMNEERYGETPVVKTEYTNQGRTNISGKYYCARSANLLTC